MEKPHDNHYCCCPDSTEPRIPERVWRSKMPDGSRTWYGILPKHSHSVFGTECEYSGLVAEVKEQ